MAVSMRSSATFAVFTLLLAAVLAPELARAQSADGPPPDLKATSLILAKVYCLIVIFFATFLPGVSPYFLRWNPTFLVLGIQFAAGVFLATAMLHFLADANDTFGNLTTKHYPFAYMLAVSGYFLTMLADLIIQWVFDRQTVSSRSPSDLEANKIKGDKFQPEGDYKNSAELPAPGAEGSNEQVPEVRNQVKATLIRKASFGDALLLMLALCFHSVFEGIAIGVASSRYDAWRNLWTISLHKVFAAISMGIALLRMVPNRPLLSVAGYSFAFAISSPIGVGIGIAIDSTTQGSTADWIYAISMGFAAGVFIYVAINHLIAKGYVPDSKVALDRPLFKFTAFVLGCGVMFVAMIWD